MDGFINVIQDLLVEIGVPRDHIHIRKKLELPGYFRPEKMWDLVIVKQEFSKKNEFIAAMELKSQVGPSFRNNFNNPTEEALGSAHDIWTAYREGAFLTSPAPWLGYLFLLEDCQSSRKPVRVSEPHFKVFPEFRDASYLDRYCQFCLRLVRERVYSSTCFLVSDISKKDEGANYFEPYEGISVQRFLASLLSRVSEFYP